MKVGILSNYLRPRGDSRSLADRELSAESDGRQRDRCPDAAIEAYTAVDNEEFPLPPRGKRYTGAASHGGSARRACHSAIGVNLRRAYQSGEDLAAREGWRWGRRWRGCILERQVASSTRRLSDRRPRTVRTVREADFAMQSACPSAGPLRPHRRTAGETCRDSTSKRRQSGRSPRWSNSRRTSASQAASRSRSDAAFWVYRKNLAVKRILGSAAADNQDLEAIPRRVGAGGGGVARRDRSRGRG
jgi:hypothetical protein